MRTKHFCFDENKCKSVEEIDQDTPASSNSQFKERGLKRKVIVENKIPFSKIFLKERLSIHLCYGNIGSFHGRNFLVKCGGQVGVKPIYYETQKENAGEHGILYPHCLKSGGTHTPWTRPPT